MKVFAAILLTVLIFSAAVVATEITLKEDAQLVNEEGKVLRTIMAGQKFSFERIDSKWVYGSYFHDAGVARGKVRSDAFKEQFFLRRKSAQFLRMMRDKGMVKHEGKWISREEKGMVKFEDQWMTPEERDGLIAAREEEKKAAEEVHDPFGAIDGDEEGLGEPSYEDVDDDPEDDLFNDEEEATDRPSKEIDWTKTGGEKDSHSIEDEEQDSGITPEKLSKYLLPGMIGMGIIMVFIVVLSAKKGLKK